MKRNLVIGKILLRYKNHLVKKHPNVKKNINIPTQPVQIVHHIQYRLQQMYHYRLVKIQINILSIIDSNRTKNKNEKTWQKLLSLVKKKKKVEN